MADEIVKGLDVLTAALQELPKNLQANALRTAVFRAAQELRDRVRDAAPISSGDPPKGKKFAKFPPGTLGNSIKAKRRRGEQGQVTASVTGVHYAKWVEFGHMLRGHRPGRVELGHVPANPFVRRTAMAFQDQAIDIMKKGLAEAIDKQKQKLAAKLPKGGS